MIGRVQEARGAPGKAEADAGAKVRPESLSHVAPCWPGASGELQHGAHGRPEGRCSHLPQQRALCSHTGASRVVPLLSLNVHFRG